MLEKNISVNFVQYEAYEPFPNNVATLGCINLTERDKLMNVLNTNCVAADACIRSLGLSYTDHVNFGHMLGQTKRNRTLNIDGMFYFDQDTKCGTPNPHMDEEAKIKRCARNLKAGKCRDEFMRKTLGAILFPQHYAKDKQK